LSKFDVLNKDGGDINYVAMIHDVSEGYQLKLPKGRPTMIEEPEDLNIDEVREAMKVNQVLLAFAWTSGEEKKMLSLFPELITFDVTEKTNKEKRGLFLAVGLDGMGKIFIPMHCFMPNSQMTSFHWVYKHAIPNLWGDEILMMPLNINFLQFTFEEGRWTYRIETWTPFLETSSCNGFKKHT